MKRLAEHPLATPVLALVTALLIGVLTPLLGEKGHARWADFLVGAVLALVLWVGLIVGRGGTRIGGAAEDEGEGEGATSRSRSMPPAVLYAAGAGFMLVAGAVMVTMIGLTGWSIGAVFAIVFAPIMIHRND